MYHHTRGETLCQSEPPDHKNVKLTPQMSGDTETGATDWSVPTTEMRSMFGLCMIQMATQLNSLTGDRPSKQLILIHLGSVPVPISVPRALLRLEFAKKILVDSDMEC